MRRPHGLGLWFRLRVGLLPSHGPDRLTNVRTVFGEHTKFDPDYFPVSEAALPSSSCQPVFLRCVPVSELFYMSGVLTSPPLQEVEAVSLPQTQWVPLSPNFT